MSVALLLAGCGPEIDAEPPQDEGSPGSHVLYEMPDAGPTDDTRADDPAQRTPSTRLPVQWALCPLYTGQFLPMAECATLNTPLYPDDPSGPRISLAIKRARASSTRAGEDQLWLLAGGPGRSAQALEGIMGHLHGAYPHLDIYTLDHRGAGGSERLSCPQQERLSSEGGAAITLSEWPACIRHLKESRWDTLSALTTTASARDLAMAIERTRDPGQRVFLYGSSYGTWLALRYLALFPEGADGVILDSVCPPGGCDLSQYDAWFDEAGGRLLDLCAEEAECASRLGPDPRALGRRAMEALDEGRCPRLVESGLDRGEVRRMLGSLLLSREARAYVPAALYRLGRCTREDADALIHLHGVLAQSAAEAATSPTQQSPALFYHVGLSELWPEPLPSTEGLLASMREMTFSPDTTALSTRLFPDWPRYYLDPALKGWPRTTTPMLLMQGALDPQAPPSTPALIKPHLGPRQSLVVFPWSGHQTLYDSPVRSRTRKHCAQQLLDQFLEAPSHPLDLTCLSDLAPISFEPDRLTPEMVLGRPEQWD